MSGMNLTGGGGRGVPGDGIAAQPAHGTRLAVLDGLRAVSILLVLGCHMLPLGPHRWGLNYAAGLMGMSIFFTLSGFLITQAPLRSPAVSSFLVRRLTRILPLAWLATLVYLAIQGKEFNYYINTLLFIINYRFQYITELTSPFWSLCVELHFYLGVALLVLLAGRRGLLALPVVGLAVTCLRVADGQRASIVTHHRVDEILAGATLALIGAGELGRLGRGADRLLRAAPLAVVFAGFFASCHEAFGLAMYLRPYCGAWLVGACLRDAGRVRAWLSSRPLRYVAEISYALYVIHPATRYGWISSGGKAVRLAKRPLALALTFALANLSTYHYESVWIALGKRLSRRWERARDGVARARPHAGPAEVAGPPEALAGPAVAPGPG
jgi:peptidoglycan/LPS O-acetylase OafA/YrhL